MKVIFTLAAFLFFTNAHSQATTETEYNYMKKGYASVESQGLDIKRGYYLEELSPVKTPTINATFFLFKREVDKSLAGIIIKTVSTESFGSGTQYWAIPAVSLKEKESYGWMYFNNDVVNVMTVKVKNIIFQWMAYQMSIELHKNYLTSNKP